MLKGVNQPTFYDVAGMVNDACPRVTIGRDVDCHMILESPSIPCLMSRLHATVVRTADGLLTMQDEGSTNGTFVAKKCNYSTTAADRRLVDTVDGSGLELLPPMKPWVLEHGDVVAFGGAESINGIPNPFMFEYVDPERGTIVECEENKTNRPTINKRRVPKRKAARAASTLKNDDDSASIKRSRGLSGCDEQTQEPQPPQQQIVRRLFENLACSICQDVLAAAHVLTCGHAYCGICLATWTRRNASCPDCRQRPTGRLLFNFETPCVLHGNWGGVGPLGFALD
jgi:pSer/pThr/pTyr-binding forkhead associated (FHA) protein